MKTIIIILFNIIFINSAFALNVNELNGTNGMEIFDSKATGEIGKSIGYCSNNSNDFLLISSNRDLLLLRELAIKNKINMREVNGTNGFIITNSMWEINADIPKYWPNGSWFITLLSEKDDQNNWSCNIINYKGHTTYPQIAISNSIFNPNQVIYVTNDIAFNSAFICGNFLNNGFALGYNSFAGPIRIIRFNNFTNQSTYLSLTDSNVVSLMGSGGTGHDIAAVKDTVGNNYDDLLIGTANNKTCWLLFGGHDWSGEVQLTEIGTNGVTFESIYGYDFQLNADPIVGKIVELMGDINDDGLSDFAYSDYGWNESINNNDQCINILFGRNNWSETSSRAW